MTNSALRTLAAATDAKLADLYATRAKLDSAKASAYGEIHRLAGDKRTYRGRKQIWGMSDTEAYATLSDRLRATLVPAYDVPAAERALNRLADIEIEINATERAVSVLDDVFDAEGGWSRFFVVRGGHIHSDISYFRCSRTPTTEHGWNPDLSGATEAEAVAELGPHMCTVCFPSAPVEWTVGKPKAAKCAGSGKYVADTGHRRYAICPDCGVSVAKNPSTFVLRAHKPA